MEPTEGIRCTQRVQHDEQKVQSFKFAFYVYIKALYRFYVDELNSEKRRNLLSWIQNLHKGNKAEHVNGHPWELIYKYFALLAVKFNKDELVKQFLSYAIGCIMGRYSTNKSGLIIANSDDILTKYKFEASITVKDAIFLLENEASNGLNQAIFSHFNIDITKAKDILATMSLNDTKLETFDNNSSTNISTAKNISYLTSLILKTYPEITEITKNPEHTLATGEKIKNSVEFKESDKFRVLGLDYSEKNSVTYAYSGNTKLIITVLNQSDDKAAYFDKLQKSYDYLFTNYQYKLALKAGTYTINNEKITFNEDIYDLFYEKHSIKDVTYLLMNKKILLLLLTLQVEYLLIIIVLANL